ncbi:MAG: leucine-rich repeat protein [Treponema sp.]|nr:leucine-rich repeat protein [Candidatus Treponema merdequi]
MIKNSGKIKAIVFTVFSFFAVFSFNSCFSSVMNENMGWRLGNPLKNFENDSGEPQNQDDSINDDSSNLYTYSNGVLTILSQSAFDGMGNGFGEFDGIWQKFPELNGKSISSIVISEGIDSIPDSAFHDVDTSSITLPSTLTHIGYNAFLRNNCTQIIIPSSVVHIDQSAFAPRSNNTLSVILDWYKEDDIGKSIAVNAFSHFMDGPEIKAKSVNYKNGVLWNY